MSAHLGAHAAPSVEPEPGSLEHIFPSVEPDAWAFRMIGEADPGLLPRVVATIAKLGLVPSRFAFDRRNDGLARIEVAVAGLSRVQADHLRLVYATMPPMRAVDVSPLGVDAGQ